MATAKKPARKKATATSTAKPTKAAARKPARAASPVRATPETLRLRSASPSFTVSDLAKSIVFYRDVLGFVEDEPWKVDGKLMGMSFLAGDVMFMLGQDDFKKGRDRKKGEGFRLYCTTVQDVDVLAREMKARGARLDQEPTDQPWGSRDFSLTDPDGYKITIAADLKK